MKLGRITQRFLNINFCCIFWLTRPKYFCTLGAFCRRAAFFVKWNEIMLHLWAASTRWSELRSSACSSKISPEHIGQNRKGLHSSARTALSKLGVWDDAETWNSSERELLQISIRVCFWYTLSCVSNRCSFECLCPSSISCDRGLSNICTWKSGQIALCFIPSLLKSCQGKHWQIWNRFEVQISQNFRFVSVVFVLFLRQVHLYACNEIMRWCNRGLNSLWKSGALILVCYIIFYSLKGPDR